MPGRPQRPPQRRTRRPRPTSRRRRALGQHFLSNTKAARRIIEFVSPSPGDRILEVGPGKGVLTRLLLETGASLVAVEKDPKLAEQLRASLPSTSDLELITADILECDMRTLSGGRPLRVVANLPYSITGEVLMVFFESIATIADLTLMLQKEVVDRIVSPPGSRVHGSLAVVAQYFTRPEKVLTLRPGSFTPPPAVSSAVVSLKVRSNREIPLADERRYGRFIHRIFGRRRQTLKNNLKAMGYSIEGIEGGLSRTGIDPERRPETLTREEFARLFRTLCG